MKKIIINLVCCLVPSKKLRHKIRRFAKRTKPQNNIIEVVKTDGCRVRAKRVRGCKIVFTGDNNHIILHEPLNELTLNVHVSSGVRVEIHSSIKKRRNIFIFKNFGKDETNHILIGKNLGTTNKVSFLLGHGSGDITVGDDCLFATDVVFRTGDFHTIFCAKTGRVLNFNQSIWVGNHVWIAERVLLLKGARVSDNSVVGARSLVNKKFEQTNVIIAGSPAKIVKEDINWDASAPYQYAIKNGLL